jgi:hypothetical protein
MAACVCLSLDRQCSAARLDLAERPGIEVDQVTVVSATDADRPSSALGCPPANALI